MLTDSTEDFKKNSSNKNIQVVGWLIHSMILKSFFLYVLRKIQTIGNSISEAIISANELDYPDRGRAVEQRPKKTLKRKNQ